MVILKSREKSHIEYNAHMAEIQSCVIAGICGRFPVLKRHPP